MRLTREIRFSVGASGDSAVANSWAGWPSATGLQPYVVLRATVEGEPDTRTGYLCSIRDIDRLLRERAIRLMNDLWRSHPLPIPGEQLIRAIARELAPHALPGTRWVRWHILLTPFLRYEIGGTETVVSVTQQFEFAAAHRLHCPSLTDAQNREIFGKCNNPNGHGHNYQVEVTVAGEPDAQTGQVIALHRLEQIVKERVIDRLDHKHLNADCPEFVTLNPSVENITRVIWDMLHGKFAPARLAKVRVWETPKTHAEYEGNGSDESWVMSDAS